MHYWVGFASGLGAAAALAAVALRLAAGPPTTLLGHLRYHVADPAGLDAVDQDGEVLLQPAAARALRAMTDAAAAAAVTLVPVSGFRDVAHQGRLFFGLAAAHNETVRQRSRTCAPPGFSEHHTGYSVDLGDGAHREGQLELGFKDTPAYAWLARHAARFHFELSFPPGNARGVAFEPWHWRFVGDAPSFRTFYFARLGAVSAGAGLPVWRLFLIK